MKSKEHRKTVGWIKTPAVASDLRIIFLLRYKSYKNVNTKEEDI
jgi:hypothetical protein